jgi:hypothetical protein
MNTKEFKEYNPEAVEQIKQLLLSESRSGTPLPFEVKVDGYIKIRKTNNVERFNELYAFVDDTTEHLVITLFIDPATDKREWYKFRLKQSAASDNLNGIDMDAKLNEKLKAYDTQQEHKRTKEALQMSNDKLIKAEEYIDTLLNQLEESKTKPNHIGNWDFGKLIGTAVEGIAINYPKVLTNVPVLNGIAKVIQEDVKTKSNQNLNGSFEGDVSFKIKEEASAQPLTAHELAIKELTEFMASKFNEQERYVLSLIIEELGNKPSELHTIADLLNIDTAPSEN